jgi:hypothetical protein
MFMFGVVVIEVWKTELPVWGFVLALLICAFTELGRDLFVTVNIHVLSIHIHCPYRCDPSRDESGNWS